MGDDILGVIKDQRDWFDERGIDSEGTGVLFTKNQWIHIIEADPSFPFTERDIEESKGYLGKYYGVNCYVQKVVEENTSLEARIEILERKVNILLPLED